MSRYFSACTPLVRPLMLLSMAAAAVCLNAQEPTLLKERLLEPAEPLGYYDRTGEAIRLVFADKLEEAVKALQQSVKDYPRDGLTWLYLADALQKLNRHSEAIPAFQKAQRLGTEVAYWYIDYALAASYLAAGDKENAYRSLEKLVFEDQFHNRPGLYNAPQFASIREEPRFLKLVGRVDTSKMSRTEGWRMDVDYLVAEIKRVNHKYRREPLPKELLERSESLKRDVPNLTDEQIYVRMGHMLAPLRQGHVSLGTSPPTGKVPHRALPLQFYAFPEGVFIVGSDETNVGLVGSEVLKIEGTPPAEMLQKMEEHGSVENEMKILWGVQGLGSLPILKGLGVVPQGRTDVRLTLRSPDGGTREVTLTPAEGEQKRKLVPPPRVAPPLFLKDVSRVHWFEAMPEHDAVFVQVNQIQNATDETIEAFGLRLRKHLADKPAKHLILDLRHNNGGSTALYPELLRTLIAHTTKEDHRLYVIIGRGVYSATGNLITDLERLAKPIFVGEPSSGFGNQDGDESRTVLPYSGMGAWLTSVWWQLSTPWDKRTSMVPDIPVQLTAKAYFEGKDPVLETILEDTRRPARPPVPMFP